MLQNTCLKPFYAALPCRAQCYHGLKNPLAFSSSVIHKKSLSFCDFRSLWAPLSGGSGDARMHDVAGHSSSTCSRTLAPWAHQPARTEFCRHTLPKSCSAKIWAKSLPNGSPVWSSVNLISLFFSARLFPALGTGAESKAKEPNTMWWTAEIFHGLLPSLTLALLDVCFTLYIIFKWQMDWHSCTHIILPFNACCTCRNHAFYAHGHVSPDSQWISEILGKHTPHS